MLAALSLPIISVLMKGSEKSAVLSADEAAALDADCILVLGAGVLPNGEPTLMLRDRILQGIELYKLGASDRLLMSGDHSRADYDEVGTMKRLAVDAGVPSHHIFMDHAGFSTYESLYRARDVFCAEKIIVVTQEYHLYRALYVAKRLGLEAYGVASDPREYDGQGWRDAREVLARAKDLVQCVFLPKPTFLGEAIPVFGNGDATNG
jgi:vancomycin permeability regulator SanA